MDGLDLAWTRIKGFSEAYKYVEHGRAQEALISIRGRLSILGMSLRMSDVRYSVSCMMTLPHHVAAVPRNGISVTVERRVA